ncbi:hypothetical protein D9M71_325670 [compost metagenome]
MHVKGTLTNLAHDGYRRAGIAWPKGETVLDHELTFDQLVALDTDPRLQLRIDKTDDPLDTEEQAGTTVEETDHLLPPAYVPVQLDPPGNLDDTERPTMDGHPETAAPTGETEPPAEAAPPEQPPAEVSPAEPPAKPARATRRPRTSPAE